MSTRAQILRLAGLKYLQSCAFLSWEAEFLGGSFDLVLICHSVPEQERERIAVSVHSLRPAIPVILIARHPRPPRGGMDAILSATPGKMIRDFPLLLSSRTAA